MSTGIFPKISVFKKVPKTVFFASPNFPEPAPN